jgi:dephospho-CoA kinase
MAIHRIGLTGGIGSGKSTVAAVWVELGAVLVDTDAIAHGLTAAGGLAMPALIDRFGPEVADAHGALDRAAMRARVFSDPSAKATLESVMHPLIGQQARQQADAAGPDVTVVFDVPLLAESLRRTAPAAGGWRERVQRVIVVDCAEATQIERVMRRPGWDRAAAERVVAQQASRRERRAIADATLHNEGLDLDALGSEATALWQALCAVGRADG